MKEIKIFIQALLTGSLFTISIPLFVLNFIVSKITNSVLNIITQSVKIMERYFNEEERPEIDLTTIDLKKVINDHELTGKSN